MWHYRLSYTLRTPPMSKNVLIISSSARRGGNSDTLCDQYAAGARDAGHSVEKIRLAEKEIGFCRGCYVCEKTGSCIQQDDMPALIEKLKAADVIVLASPVYFYTICARLKNFIDRTVAIYPYKGFAGKVWQFIITAAEDEAPAMQHALGDFQGFMECMEEPIIKDPIMGLGAWNMGDIQNNPAMQAAYAAGKEC